MLAVENVSVRLDGALVVRGVSLDVRAGEVVGVAGPNGAGKTTLLRAIAGTVRPSSGSVTIGGRDVSKLPRREVARLVGVVPQEKTADIPGFTVREAVAAGAYARSPFMGAPPARVAERIESALAVFDIAALADDQFARLSGGEKQRVYLARTYVQDTPLVLMDEPTSFLDLKHQQETMRLVRALAGESRAVLVITHDLAAAAAMCARMYLMAAGRIVASGATKDVLTVENVAQAFAAEMPPGLGEILKGRNDRQ
jgi:iron complex transport system ATP-binding protein